MLFLDVSWVNVIVGWTLLAWSKKRLRFSSDSVHFMSTSSMKRNQESGLWGADFIKDLNELNLDFSNFSDVNLAYENFNHQFTQVYDKHVPLKKRAMVKSPVPYMNSKLRKAVYKKRQLHNVFKTQRSSKSWEQYWKQRNIVTRIKRKSIRNFF